MVLLLSHGCSQLLQFFWGASFPVGASPAPGGEFSALRLSNAKNWRLLQGSLGKVAGRVCLASVVGQVSRILGGIAGDALLNTVSA